jgi:hypothetical protein
MLPLLSIIAREIELYLLTYKIPQAVSEIT